MYLVYGGYRHSLAECAVIRNLDRELGPAGETVRIRRVWQVNGQIHADNYLSLQSAKLLLEAAYSRDYQDVVLYHNDGTTIHDTLLNAGSTSGVRVTSGPNYPQGEGAEGGTFLSYQITLEATYEPPNREANSALESFQETVQESGGGPRFAIVETVDGDPVRQMINLRTKFRYTQSGTAVGRYGYPSAPLPIWPQWENMADRSVTRNGPVKEGNKLTRYTVSWSYVFESTEQLSGLPNVFVM